MRRRESASGAIMRANYSKYIQDYVKKMVDAKNYVDVTVVQEEFALRCKEHLAALQDELKLKLRQTVLSRELLIAIVASSTQTPNVIANIDPAYATLIGVGALGRLWVDYRAGRRQSLEKSPLGYLYKNKRFPHY